MIRALFPESPGYLRRLSAQNREKARALFIFLNSLTIMSTVFGLLLNLFLNPLPIVNILIATVIAITFVSLTLLHRGHLRWAGNLVSGSIFIAVLGLTYLDAIGLQPIFAFTQVGMMVASLGLAALFGSKRLPLVFAGIYSATILGLVAYLSRLNGWDSWRDLSVEFALDGILSLAGGSILLYLLRRIYDRSLAAISTRNRRLERFLGRLRLSETRFHRLSDASFEAVMLSENGRILEANRAFTELFGMSIDPHYPVPMEDVIAVESGEKLQSLLESNDRSSEELLCRRFDGSTLLVEARSSVIPDRYSSVRSIVMRDITRERENRMMLEYLAFHDSLTGLGNRKQLQESADRLLRAGRRCALLLADLDRFKEINDTLGHPFGDALLQGIADRLRQQFPEPFLVCRTGGDEFALLVPDADSEAMIADLARSMGATIGNSLQTDGVTLEMECSIGAALTPNHAVDIDGLLRCADVAMYAAKRAGIGLAVYARVLDLHSPRRLQLLSDLGRMIRQQSFHLNFQPKVDLFSKTIDGYEVLTRWRHPELGMISPTELIPLAEAGNHIGPLTESVIAMTLKQMHTWSTEDFCPSLSVNVSARNLIDEEFPSRVISAVQEQSIDPRRLELEITESAFMHDPERALHSVVKLNQAGITLSIDDFGTGYSSLSYLTDLPVQALKIDLSFVREMMVKEKHQILVSSTIQLAHGLGLAVIAEGVENEATAQALTRMECDFGQGFHFGEPVPASAVFAKSL